MEIGKTTGRGHRLEDYSALEYILLGDLRDLLEEPADNVTCHWLCAVIDALLETLPKDFQLRCQGGYLSEVTETYPNWQGQVDELKAGQHQLYSQLWQLRLKISNEERYEEIASEARGSLQDWMHELIAHQRHERRLMQSAFNLEIGCGD